LNHLLLVWPLLTSPFLQIETDSPLGVFFRLTTLPDDPTVGDRYFANPMQMPAVLALSFLECLSMPSSLSILPFSPSPISFAFLAANQRFLFCATEQPTMCF
jgi:hypothetical protein